VLTLPLEPHSQPRVIFINSLALDTARKSIKETWGEEWCAHTCNQKSPGCVTSFRKERGMEEAESQLKRQHRVCC
jgi:hypothetical protein